jgi:carbon-monoxide dehydrogenase large subunit
MVDLLAVELKMDPTEIRFKNYVQPDQFPFPTAAGLIYDSGDYGACLQKAMDMIGYPALRAQQAEARAAGRLMGIGISTYGELCGFGPSPATPAGGWESAMVRVEPSGKVTIHTGTSPHGQGQETSFCQIAADELGIPMDDIIVLHGDTAIVQYGIGTFGSRNTAVGGPALWYALQEIREKVKKFGKMLLNAEGEVVFEDGKCTDPATGKEVSFQTIAAAAYRALKLPPDTDPGLVVTKFWEPSNFAFPFGAHIIVSEVDAETGQIEIVRYVAVDDIGNQLNPLLVEGQLHGGVAQGLGQALWEHGVYDDNGQLLTGEFMDYVMPRARMMPWIESGHTITPSPVNPLGVKGVGEAGTIGSTPAMVNSVIDALSHLGIRHLDMPLTPEKVWNAINGAKA